MAGSPEAVLAFLGELGKRLKPVSEAEHRELEALKAAEEGGEAGIEPWDVLYYTHKARLREDLDAAPDLRPYLPLPAVTEGLRRLSAALFGLELRKEALAPGERWDGAAGAAAPGLKRLGLFEDGRHVASIYMDLLPRPDKYPHSAHFTIRCGCAVDPLEDDGEYQVPSVALVFNFGGAQPGAAPPASDAEVLLHHGEAETLFHEFGHALQSALSRTRYQHLSGTRVPVDFVETPSHLFEYFVWDGRVLDAFAAHKDSGAPIPPATLAKMRRGRRQFAGVDTQKQVLYALLDQHLFGARAAAALDAAGQEGGADNLDLLGISAETSAELTGSPGPDGDAWFAHFGHFTGYGAGYYGYLYARVFAAQIWGDLFAADPWDGEAGGRLWRDMLAKGNARDAHLILRDLLGREPALDCFLDELKQEPAKAAQEP
uniref:Peptidase M3A/M3B catalytic domain-containing protein n=1 Tax=Phaeomonas parva TaxID=124430 RepID=A0A7S1UFL5_9STRA